MQDLQLAIAVARAYEGDDGLIFRELLEDRVLPQAALEGNRWLATWAFWMLGRRDMAVRVLIVCISAGGLRLKHPRLIEPSVTRLHPVTVTGNPAVAG